MDKSSFIDKSIRKQNLVNNSNNFSFMKNKLNDNHYLSPDQQESYQYKNLKISPNNLKYFNFISRSTNHNNMGFLTKTNFKNKKKNYNREKEKSSFIINNTSILQANQNADQSINLFENNILTNGGSNNSKTNTNLNLNKINIMETTQNNINIQENNAPNANPNSNNSNNNTMLNINMINSPNRNGASNQISVLSNNNMNNNNNLPIINRGSDRKKTFKSNGNKNELINNLANMNNTQKDPNMVSKEEKELLNRIGAGINYRDYNSEKNKFLETVYEKLNDKNTSNLKEQTTDYCQRFLNYSNKDIEDLVSK